MAAISTKALATLGKKAVIDIITKPDKVFKIIIGIIIFILAIVLVLILPIILILSIPAILINGDSEPEVAAKQLEIITMYQETPITISQENLNWIEAKKEEYRYCDDFEVSYSFDLSCQHLMAVDSVILEQDFTTVNKKDIYDIGKKFLIREAYTNTYEEEEKYETKEKYKKRIFIIDPKSGEKVPKIVTKTRTVTKTRVVKKHKAIIKLTTKPFETVLDELDFSDEDKKLAINIYNTIRDSDVEGNLNIYDDVDLSNLKEYPPGEAEIPYFNQGDKRWGASSYGNSTIYSGGCGPTSLAMVVVGLTGKSDVNPKVVADWSYSTGHRAEGQGSYWSLMTDGGKHYGLSVESVSRKSPNKIMDALSKGFPIIASMGRGHFTKGGHFIVLRGVTKNGKILVHDPASVVRSQKSWDIGIIINESSTLGGVNGSPFWIFKF